MRIVALFTSLVFATAGWTEAPPVSGNELYAACQDASVQAKQGYSIGYIQGVVEGLRLGTTLPFLASGNGATEQSIEFGNMIFGACIPDEVVLGQMRDVSLAYMQSRPELRHESARLLILEALQAAFPCP